MLLMLVDGVCYLFPQKGAKMQFGEVYRINSFCIRDPVSACVFVQKIAPIFF